METGTRPTQLYLMSRTSPKELMGLQIITSFTAFFVDFLLIGNLDPGERMAALYPRHA